MRIKSLELAWFRGAADPVTLDLNCKSMVLYGNNGSGKSSFIDAVEYVLHNGRIEHLTHEYSSPHQANAIPNTHKPKTSKTALQIKFEDDSDIQITFMSNGAPKNADPKGISMDEWEYRQTILRQHEVSAFTHNTKGEKYSALLPLFGLQHMEVAADNLRQITKTVRTEAGLTEKQTKVKQIELLRTEVFATLSDEGIVRDIADLFLKYCQGATTTGDAISRCDDIDAALESDLEGYSAENQKHFFLKHLADSQLEARANSVRAASVDLADSTEPSLSEKLEVLQSAAKFGATLEGVQEMDCPACGQAITVEAFREHVRVETDRLRELYDAFTGYKAAIGSVCSSLDSLKSDIRRSELKTWREGIQDSVGGDGFRYLGELHSDALRENCSDEDLTAIECNLLPIIETAKLDSIEAPSDVKELTHDKKRASAAKAVIASQDLKSDITNTETLVAYMEFLEQEVRFEIRKQSQRVIDTISKDIESMWATLHPGEKIDNVRLLIPQGIDKAIDVVLKFHGLNQDSPRLTLSEGYRNSLGLCIFLAMAKQVADKDRPLFLDDVVVSLDRNHRGMIHELIVREFGDRQVVIFTHDREWYTELRHQLGDSNQWAFKTLLPYESPEIGIRFSSRTTTFDDARAQLVERPDSAGNDARKIMDVELPMIAEHLRTRLPYLRSDKNDRRTAHEILTRLVADAKKCFQKKSVEKYVKHCEPIDALAKADSLLVSWGNPASHGFNTAPAEARKLIESCEAALASFKCVSCKPPTDVWRVHDEQSEILQCRCGEIRWRYGKA